MEKLLVLPKDGLMVEMETYQIIKEATNRGMEVTVSCATEEIQKHLTKLCEEQGFRTPKTVITGSKRYKRAIRHSKFVLAETNKDKPEKTRKHQRVVILADLFEKFPNIRPSFDAYGVADREKIEKMLLADRVRRNNQKIYFAQLQATDQNSDDPKEYAGVSFQAIKLMELDALLGDDELLIYNMPREYTQIINKKAYKHIVVIYWRYDPAELLAVSDALVTDDNVIAKGFDVLGKNGVVDWALPVKDIIAGLRNKVAILQNDKLYDTENTRTYLDYITEC